MSNVVKNKNLNHLNKLLSRVFPEKKKARSLFVIFFIITFLGLVCVFLSSFFVEEEHWNDITLSISSGIFASGLFATSVEWINIRNKKTLIKMKLTELKFYCHNYIDLISDELFDISESHTYSEWINILLKQYRKDKTIIYGLSSRLDDLIKSASFFLGNEYDDFNNPFPSNETLFEIKRLVIICKSTKNAIFSSNNNEKTLLKHLDVRIPSVIVGLFPDLSGEFNKKTSYERDEKE